jgi:predicted 3-demethylubiquinone-9 3-methyltransferase (glyoxalase superfamily)
MDMKVTLTSCISPHELNESFSFIVNCHAQAEIDYYWSALTAGGGQELKYGCLTDKFGVTWQIIPDAFDELMNDTDKERFQRVEAVVLRSQKINIREIMKAYYND